MRGGRATTACFLLALLGACGGAAATGEPTPARSARTDVAREPVRVDLSARRVGSSLRLDIEGVGRGVTDGEPFEDPQRWRIRARSEGRLLQRLVNGPVEIDRRPVGGVESDRWDTVVRFSVVYEVPKGSSSVDVRVEPPDPRARPIKRSFRL